MHTFWTKPHDPALRWSIVASWAQMGSALGLLLLLVAVPAAGEQDTLHVTADPAQASPACCGSYWLLPEAPAAGAIQNVSTTTYFRWYNPGWLTVDQVNATLTYACSQAASIGWADPATDDLLGPTSTLLLDVNGTTLRAVGAYSSHLCQPGDAPFSVEHTGTAHDCVHDAAVAQPGGHPPGVRDRPQAHPPRPPYGVAVVVCGRPRATP